MTTQSQTISQPKQHRVCPWWMGYLLDNPLRRMMHPAHKILGPHVSRGMTVLDFGCGFGLFSLGMARLIGESGQVIAVDVQQKMLDKTMSRAQKAGLDQIIQPLLCNGKGIGEPLVLDFALVCNVLHETPDPATQLAELYDLIKPGGRMLLMEPAGHMSHSEFEGEVEQAGAVGFVERERPKIFRQMSVLLEKSVPQGDA